LWWDGLNERLYAHEADRLKTELPGVYRALTKALNSTFIGHSATLALGEPDRLRRKEMFLARVEAARHARVEVEDWDEEDEEEDEEW